MFNLFSHTHTLKKKKRKDNFLFFLVQKSVILHQVSQLFYFSVTHSMKRHGFHEMFG